MELIFWLSPIFAAAAAVATIYRLRNADAVPAILLSMLFYLLGLLTLFYGVRYSKTHDTETWTAFAKTVVFKEGWTEIRTRTVSDGKNTRVETETIQHSPEWRLIDTSDNHVSITPETYASLARRWGHDPHTHDWNLGREYSYAWKGDDATSEVVSTHHGFENRVQASNSVFRRRPLTKEELLEGRVFDYHDIRGSHTCPAVYGVFPGFEALEQRISKFNARYGKEKQVRVHVLVFRNESMDVANLQERHWGNGKKNELNVCIGIENDRIVWAQVFSWCEQEDMKAELRNALEGLPRPDPTAIADLIEKAVLDKWERKHFADFRYLPIDLPTWAVVLAWLWAGAWILLIPISKAAIDKAGPPRFRR